MSLPRPSGFQLTGPEARCYEQALAPIMGPFVAALADLVAPAGPGRCEILDLACGPGFVTRAVAGPGDAVGVDLNRAMIETARVTGGDLPARWCRASALSLPFAEGSFDAVLCQQGFQFFPDTDRAAAEARRVCRSGAVAAATVWAAPERSPYFHAQGDALARVTGADARSRFDTAFALAGPVLAGAFTRAGWTDVSVGEVRVTVRLPPLDVYVPDQLAAVPWGEAAVEAGPEAVRAVTRLMAESLAGHRDGGGAVTVPFVAWLVAGRR